MKKTVIIFLFLSCTLSLNSQERGNERFAQVVNRLVEAMNIPDYNRIVQEYNPGMVSAFPLNKTTLFFGNIESQFGKVVKVDSPQVKSADQAVILMYFEHGAQDLTLYLDDQGKIKGFMFTLHILAEPQPSSEQKPQVNQPPTNTVPVNTAPAADKKPISSPPPANPKPTQPATVAPPVAPPKSTQNPINTTAQPTVPAVPDKQKTELYPPFKGPWQIIADGESRESVSQFNPLQQKYSYSFSAVDGDGSRYKNDGKSNEDFIGYEKDIIAPANGTIVEVIDGVHDNFPGTRNLYTIIGNTIIIQHSNKEYSVLSFLKQGSIKVKVGDKVTRGQIIAQCGNSGNATEPALHYHLQDSPYLQTAKNIKFYFERITITKNGKKGFENNHFPKTGEIISTE